MRVMVIAVSVLSISGALAATSNVLSTPPAGSPHIDRLLSELAKTISGVDAKPLEQQILAQFLQSGSPSVDLLMTRAAAAVAAGDVAAAGKLLDAVTEIAPAYAEGWHQRGKLQAVAGDDAGAIISLQKAVTLNPREFAALAELGRLLIGFGDKRDALAVLRRAIALDPHLDDVDREVRQLSRDVEGERI